MEIESPIRDKPPCKDCSERCVTESFNCHDSCPKDNRGEFGYKAWREKVDCVSKARKEYSFKAAIFSKIT
jgi:hypothetical protein